MLYYVLRHKNKCAWIEVKLDSFGNTGNAQKSTHLALRDLETIHPTRTQRRAFHDLAAPTRGPSQGREGHTHTLERERALDSRMP